MERSQDYQSQLNFDEIKYKNGKVTFEFIKNVTQIKDNYSGMRNYLKDLVEFKNLKNHSENGVAKKTFKIKKVGDPVFKVMKFFEKTTNKNEPDYLSISLSIESEFIVPCINTKIFRNGRKTRNTLYIATFPYYKLTLAKLLAESSPKIERHNVINYGYCVAKAIQVFHNKKGIHRTVHPDNIMILENGKALLLHSQFYKELKEAVTSSTGTTQLKYKPPDMLAKEGSEIKYGPSVDVWAFGLVMNQMLIGKFPFEFSISQTFQKNVDEYVQSISDWGSSDDKIKQLIYLCLKLEPTERISIDEAVAMLEELKDEINDTKNTECEFQYSENSEYEFFEWFDTF